MLKSTLTASCLAAIAGAAMMTLLMTPASAFTLTSPSLAPQVAAAQIDDVQYRRYHRYHRHRHCWRGRYGRLHCGW